MQDNKLIHVLGVLQKLPNLERLAIFVDLRSIRQAIHQARDADICYEYDTGSWYTHLNEVVEDVLPGLRDFIVLGEWPRYFQWTRATRDAVMVMQKYRMSNIEEGYSLVEELSDNESIGSSIYIMCEENENDLERWEWPFGLA